MGLRLDPRCQDFSGFVESDPPTVLRSRRSPVFSGQRNPSPEERDTGGASFPSPRTMVKLVFTCASRMDGCRSYENTLEITSSCFNSLFSSLATADSVHTAPEQAGEDASREILRPTRGFREAQARVRSMDPPSRCRLLPSSSSSFRLKQSTDLK